MVLGLDSVREITKKKYNVNFYGNSIEIKNYENVQTFRIKSTNTFEIVTSNPAKNELHRKYGHSCYYGSEDNGENCLM